jgi:hypothetical protein
MSTSIYSKTTTASALQVNTVDTIIFDQFGNINFPTAGSRITGDFSNATHANRFMFQTSTLNSNTSVGACPNGTAVNANFTAYGNSSVVNAPYIQMVTDGALGRLIVGAIGTGTFLPLTLETGGAERMRINTAGNVGIGTTSITNTLEVNGTIGGTWAGATISIAKGGTGQITANAALNAFLPTQTGNSGKVLTTDGTNTSWSAAAGGGAISSITGTANQVIVSTPTGAVVLSTPQNIHTGATPTFARLGTGAAPTYLLDVIGAGATNFNTSGIRTSYDATGQAVFLFQGSGYGANLGVNIGPDTLAKGVTGANLNVGLNGSLTFSNFAGATVGAGATSVTRLFIDVAGHVGIGATPPAWGNVGANLVNSIDLGTVGSIAASSSQVYMGYNNYLDASTWRYKTAAKATLIYGDAANALSVASTATVGTVGGAITWTVPFNVDYAGNGRFQGACTAVGAIGSSGLNGLCANGGDVWNAVMLSSTNNKSVGMHFGGDTSGQLRFGRYASSMGGWEANPFVFNMNTGLFNATGSIQAAGSILAGQMNQNGFNFTQGGMGYSDSQGLIIGAKTGSAYDFSLINPANNSYIFNVPTGTSGMNITGNVGIGGASAQKLDVFGRIRVRAANSSDAAAVIEFMSNDGGYAYWYKPNGLNQMRTDNPLYVASSVGCGDISCNALTMTGLGITKTNGATLVQDSNDTCFSVRGTTSVAAAISFHRAGAYAINIGLDTDNIFKIGGWSAGAVKFLFEMGGNFYATGNIVGYYSDMRLKTKVRDIDNAIDKVKQLSGFIYKNNELAKSVGFKTDAEQVALSAQDVEKVMPQVVSLAPFDVGHNLDGTTYSLSGENYKTVDYAKLVPLLVEAIKEQQVKIERLESLLGVK